MSTQRRHAIIFPSKRKILDRLGENITLAMKRRRITQDLMHRRTMISKPTLRKIMKGDPTVSLGHYVMVLGVLRLAEDLVHVAEDDVFGRKLQDIELLRQGRQTQGK